jgi:AbiV family abortive infection protein
VTDEHRQIEYIRFTGTFTRRGPIARHDALYASGLCVANGRLLIEAAEKLQSAAAAVGLAVTSLEEIAKADLLLLTATIDRDDSPQWRRFWNSFTSHRPKLESAVGGFVGQFGAILSDATRQFEASAFARTLDKIKQASWYVDRVNGQFFGPGQTFGPHSADLVITEARRQATDAIKNLGIHPLFYDDLAQFAKGITTVRELWLAQVEIAKYRRSSRAGAFEDLVRQKLKLAAPEILNGNVYD